MVRFLVFAAVLLLFEALAWRYGADSRDGNDWTMRCTPRQSPNVR